ncbi:MAG: CocE/NonD family hydrolase [bacterium]|nr:CocE/NonD family hydrolase [bacterium]
MDFLKKYCFYFVIITIILFSVILVNGTALAAGDTASKESIEEELKKAGIMDCTVTINVRIPVPESENPYIDQSQYDDEGDADLWAVTITPNRVKTDGPQPTILLTTAYKKEIVAITVAPMVRFGYNVVMVDMRGSGSSEGHWHSMSYIESYDVKYIIDRWIPAQDWSDGRIGMVGGSYMAILQMLAGGLIDTDANGEPIHLKACVANVPYSDVYADIGVHGGNFNLEFMSFWIILTETLNSMPGTLFLGEDNTIPDFSFITSREDFEEAVEEWMASIRQFPEPLYDVIFNTNNDMRNEDMWQKSPIVFWPDKPANGWSVGTQNEGSRVFPAKLPVVIVAGWYDIFTRGTLNQYTYGLSRHSNSDKALIIGDWYHLEGAFGMGLNSMIDMSFHARWFDWKIRGADDCFMKEFPVMLRVMGENRWRAEKSWPLPESRVNKKTFYLSKRIADPINGDPFTENKNFWGTTGAGENLLYSLVDAKQDCDFYAENPVLKHSASAENLHGEKSKSVVRWCMGIPALVSSIPRMYMGIDIEDDMPWEDERDDEEAVPTFSTAPLEEDMEIIGPISLRFWAKTEFKERTWLETVYQDSILDIVGDVFDIDTDSGLIYRNLYGRDVQFVAELNDVFPNGRAKNISSGWLRASHRQRDPNELSGAAAHAIDPDYTPFDPFYFEPDTNPENINENELYEYVIEIWPTCNVFKAGHRVRISLSGSDWPHLLPVLTPSWNEIVIDENHEARLDFTVTNTANEGATWKWIGPSGHSYEAFNSYLLEHKDDPNAPDSTVIAGSDTESGENVSFSASSSGGCGSAANAATGSYNSAAGILPGLLSTLFMMLFPLALIFIRKAWLRR